MEHWFVVGGVAVVEVADQNLVLEAKKITKMHRFYNLKYCIANNISLYHSLDKGNFFKQLLSILEYIKL